MSNERRIEDSGLRVKGFEWRVHAVELRGEGLW